MVEIFGHPKGCFGGIEAVCPKKRNKIVVALNSLVVFNQKHIVSFLFVLADTGQLLSHLVKLFVYELWDLVDKIRDSVQVICGNFSLL